MPKSDTKLTSEQIFNNSIDTIVSNINNTKNFISRCIKREEYERAEKAYKSLKCAESNLIRCYLEMPFTDKFVKQAYKVLYKGDYYGTGNSTSKSKT